MESLDYEGRSKPWYRKKRFWLIVAPLLISFAFTLAVSALQPQAGKSRCQPALHRRAAHACWLCPAQCVTAWACLLPTAFCLLQGILYLVLGESQKLGAFQAWRVLFWIAG